MNKDLSKFLKLFLLFIAAAFTGYVLLICIWGDLAPGFLKVNLHYRIGSVGHMHTRLEEVKKTKNIDVLFLGSSHTYRGFDTRLFAREGYTSFNLGSSLQTPIQTKVLLNRYLEDLSPEIIVFEVYPFVFCNNGVEASVDVIANDANDFETLKMAFETNHIKTYNTLIYGFYNDAIGRRAAHAEKLYKQSEKTTYVPGGYIEKDPQINDKKVVYPSRRWEFDTCQFEAFEEILTLIKSKNIRFALVYAPIPKVLYDSYKNHSDFDNRMNKYGHYYNFNELMALDDVMHFNDANHLNQKGVELFNSKLMDTVDYFRL